MESTSVISDDETQSSHIPNPEEVCATKELLPDTPEENFAQIEAPPINERKNDLTESGVGSEESSSSGSEQGAHDEEDMETERTQVLKSSGIFLDKWSQQIDVGDVEDIAISEYILPSSYKERFKKVTSTNEV